MEKILVVDDEQDVRELIRNSLKKEYDVTACENIKDTDLDLLKRYDLILLDVMLKENDGFGICIKIRDLVDCPIIFLTARTMEADVDYGLSVGADDYLRKPFSVNELRARVRAHLRREKREHQSVLVRDEVRFYLKNREVYYGEVPISLTSSEYDILLLLAKYPGQVFSKEEIYENIYGYEKDGNDSAIAEHVKNIRKKLSEKNLQCIETVWGIGYRWKK